MRVKQLSKTDIKDALELCKKDTPRKQKLYIKMCMREEMEFIEYLKESFKRSNDYFVWYLGDRYTLVDLTISEWNYIEMQKYYQTIQ